MGLQHSVLVVEGFLRILRIKYVLPPLVMNVRLTFRTGLALLFTAAAAPAVALADLASSASLAADQTLTPQEEEHASSHAHYLAGRSLEQDGKMRAAVDHYIAFLQSGADEPELAAHIAELALNYRGLDATLTLLEQVAQAHPTRPGPALNQVLFSLTHAEEKAGLLASATALSMETLKKFPKDPAVYESAVRVQLLQGEKDDAIAIMDEAAKKDVPAVDFWLRIARVAQEVWPLADPEHRTAHLARINAYYDKALARASRAHDAESQLEIGDFYLFSNQLDRAVKVCETLAKHDQNLDAQKRLVRLYDAMDRQADSLTALESLVQSHPSDVEHRRLLASEYMKKQEIPQAVEQLEAALKAGGGDLNDYLQISNLLLFSEKPEKLDRFTLRAQRLYPGEPRVGFYRALALNELKKYPEAASLFSQTAVQAETMAPELLDDRFNFSWGVALERSGNFDEAAKRFDKSIQLTPTDGNLDRVANTMNYLGYMWLERGQHYDKAEQLIVKANELVRNNPAFIDSLGWLRLKQGRAEEALKELLRAESLMDKVTREDAEILDHIAQAYDQLGQQDKAKEYWQRTLALDPEAKGIRERAEKALGVAKQPEMPKAEKE